MTDLNVVACDLSHRNSIGFTYERDDGIVRSWIDHIICSLLLCPSTVEPPNKVEVGAWALVHYSGVVLYRGSFCQKALFVCCEYRIIHTLSLQITMVSLGTAVATMCPWLQMLIFILSYRQKQ